ncbi:MAG: T9SS type A sorting domain-containing protein, partial [Ignavibacteriae bacterium]|nr:T9SS type A sorting domain-containing protein [Ignavibacteriota bacterium]
FFNLTDRVFRHGKTGWDVKKVIVDHCTSLTTSGWHGFLQLGKAHEVTVTNNVFFNPIAFGSHYNRVLGGSEFEQSQPENDLMYVVTLDTVFADSKIIIENNNIFWEQQYKDLWAAYPDSTKAPGLLTPTIAGANSVSGDGYFSEALTFAAPSPSTYDYHQLGLTSINETIYPENFYFGLSSDVDVSYGTSAASYTAAAGGFPLGDLNAYPDKKVEWNNAGRPTDVNDEQINSLPNEFKLSQNYPNPFNPSTTINFSIPVKGNYSLRVYNIMGQEITTLINGQLNIGHHNLNFDASQLSSGIYFYTLSGNNVNITKKMILMK